MCVFYLYVGKGATLGPGFMGCCWAHVRPLLGHLESMLGFAGVKKWHQSYDS